MMMLKMNYYKLIVHYTFVMKQFINCKCFEPYIIYNKNKCEKYRNIIFDVLKDLQQIP